MATVYKGTRAGPVSRRRLLVSAPALPLLGGSSAPDNLCGESIELLWKRWKTLHARASELCRCWQELESLLVKTIGFPKVQIPNGNLSTNVYLHSHAEIDAALVGGEVSQETAVILRAEFDDYLSRWDAEAERLGFNKIKRQECEAWDAEAEAVGAILRTPATTLAGIEIKLVIAIKLCTCGSDDPNFPEPQLHAILSDLTRIRRTVQWA